ncbi:hypothetical protein PTTG_06748 [Puccinia triticina 1-1 BBBD Race 1]|uniref:Uncharacterized protein n=1 Tax=Puccinia triticina (isolate 1-1 / race 1 (BBBD)) TaxID=630390 RepID=A0A180GNQ8_PUCT1|nr:hypothetical protein PTTG_06748 [Puccinia triticina 1-1 BBBD Race 1]
MVKIKSPNKRLCFDGTKVERFIETYEMVASLDEATELDMAKQIRLFLANNELLDILETLDGFSPPDWPKLKSAMIAYWGKVDTARFTTRDLTSLVTDWSSKGGVATAEDYQAFRQSWEPIQSYLLSKAHIDSVEEIRNSYYQSFSSMVQDEIRRKLVRDRTMVTTLDNRFKLPTFQILKEAVDAVMKEQTALMFEESKTSRPVAPSQFLDGNLVMRKMGEERRPREAPAVPKPAPDMDELLKLFEAFEQRIDQKIAAIPAKPSQPSGTRPPMVFFYCHREGHGTKSCFELQKDKEEKLVEQKGTNFFLPNGALIPWDSSRPIQHVVASFPSPRVNQATAEPSGEYKAGCGSLQQWYPPAVSSQSFSSAYEADPAGRKRHEDPKLYKAPSVPSSAAKQPIRRTPVPKESQETQAMEEEPELFERGSGDAQKESDSRPDTPSQAVKPVGPKKIFDLPVPHMTVAELLALAPTVAEGVKKWVSRRRVEVGAEELKVHSGTLAEGDEVICLVS